MEKAMKQENILGTASIGALLVKFAVPGIISMVVNSFYNIVDQIFIGWGVGYLGNGATTVVFPFTMLAMAFYLMLGDGAASYISLQLGKKQQKKADEGASAGVVSVLIAGVILFTLYNIFLQPMCLLFGATDAILPYALDYGRIISYGMIFLSICTGFSSIIRADGNPRFNMLGLLAGCAVNLTLDPIFIFVCGWGVKGAAWATILGQLLNALLNIYYMRKKLSSVTITRDSLRRCGPTVPRIAKLGVSSFINQMALVVAMTVRNNVLTSYGAVSKYGADIPVTTMGITMKVFSILMAIVLGLSAGAQPIFGYNYGAGKYDRVKKTFRVVAIIATVVMTAAFLVAQLFPEQILNIFGTGDALYEEFGTKCMQIYLMLIPTAGIQMMSGVFFQAMGYPGQSALISLSKQIIFQLPVTLLMPMLLGIDGALWAGPVSDALAFTVTVLLLLIYWKKIFRSRELR